MRRRREKEIADRQIEIKRMETARLLIVRLRVRPDASTSPSTPSSPSSHNLPITPPSLRHITALGLTLKFSVRSKVRGKK